MKHFHIQNRNTVPVMKTKFSKFICAFALIISFCLLSAVSTISCFAAATPQITVGNAQGKPGDTVDITIKMSDNPGFVSANLYVKYDESVLTLKEVKDGGLLSGVTHSDNYTCPYGLCWINDLATSNFKVNGLLATLTFEISKNAPNGKTTISLEQDILDCNIEDVVFELKSGSVEVTGSSNSAGSSQKSSDNSQNSSDSSVKSDSSQSSNGALQEDNSDAQTVSDVKDDSSSVAENGNSNQDGTDEKADSATSTRDSADKGGTIVLWIIIGAIIVIAAIFVILYVLHRRRQKQ